MPSALLWASSAETLFWILQIRQGCGPAGFAFSREGVPRTGWPFAPPADGFSCFLEAVWYNGLRRGHRRCVYGNPFLPGTEIEQVIRELLHKYHAEYALLFGSYARGDATPNSDIDLVVVGGPGFRARDIFALGEELRQLTRKDADVFELRELNTGTPFYNTVMQEGVRIA